ncbi:hypothetical protein K501DRAFT_264645 [Backusella circina FSU 941]|nr:hypothetical protein K501DRAFT_264645 [Backusella circina FSU 941]
MPIAVPFFSGARQFSIELAEPVVLLRGPPTDGATQVLRGEVHLLLSKPMTSVQTIVKLVGKSTMLWPEGLGPRGSKVYHEKTILEQNIILDTRPEDEQVLPAGLHQWPFEFLIPNRIVETIEDDMATVQYFVEATIQRPSLSLSNLRCHRNLLLLRTLSWSDDALTSNALPTTSIVAERRTEACDATIYIEKSIASSGTQFPISIVLMTQMKHVHLEAINVILTEKRIYQVPEYNAHRAELHDFKLQLASVTNMTDVEQMHQAMLPVSELSLQEIRKAISTKNAHIPLGVVPFQYRFLFTLPNCLTLNHTTYFKEMNFLHRLKIDIELSVGTNEPIHVHLAMPITILDCRLKDDYTTLPTYQQSMSDTLVDHDDENEKRDGFFMCPCYLEYKKKSNSGNECSMINRQNSSETIDFFPPPAYNALDSKN